MFSSGVVGPGVLVGFVDAGCVVSGCWRAMQVNVCWNSFHNIHLRSKPRRQGCLGIGAGIHPAAQGHAPSLPSGHQIPAVVWKAGDNGR